MQLTSLLKTFSDKGLKKAMAIVLSPPPKNKFCESNIQFAFQFDVFLQSKPEVDNYHLFLMNMCLFNASNESTVLFTFFDPFL